LKPSASAGQALQANRPHGFERPRTGGTRWDHGALVPWCSWRPGTNNDSRPSSLDPWGPLRTKLGERPRNQGTKEPRKSMRTGNRRQLGPKAPRRSSRLGINRDFHQGSKFTTTSRFHGASTAMVPMAPWSLAHRTPWFQAAMRDKAFKDAQLPWDRGRDGINVSICQRDLGDRCPSIGLPPSFRAGPGASTTLKDG